LHKRRAKPLKRAVKIIIRKENRHGI
jgi:hypothetical protein